MIISFVGHSAICAYNKVKEAVKQQIRRCIGKDDKITCYLGGYGDFDEICALACRELKKEYLGIELVYVSPYITLQQQARIKDMQEMGLYDASIYPPIEGGLPKFAILKRNEWMMMSSDIIIAYVNHNYGGAYKTLQMAVRGKKNIINICDFL